MKKEPTDSDLNSQSNTQFGITVGILTNTVNDIKENVKDIGRKLEVSFATKEWVNGEYGLVKAVVFSILGLFGTGVVLAFISLVIKK